MKNIDAKRKELAIAEAHKLGFCSSLCPENELDDDLGWGFLSGVEWADENPKSDTVNKHEFIEKTWQWLKAHIKFETITYSDVWDTSVVDILATDFTTVDEMEKSFRKIMEE